MRVAIRPVSSPTRNASDHFKNMYCSTWADDLLLQSCLKRSFSLILHPPQLFNSVLINVINLNCHWKTGEEIGFWFPLIVQALYMRDLGPNYGQRIGGECSASLQQWLVQWIAFQVPLFPLSYSLHAWGGGGCCFCNLAWIFLHQGNGKLQRQRSLEALMEMEMEVIELVPPAPLVLELKTKKGESSVHIYIYIPAPICLS